MKHAFKPYTSNFMSEVTFGVEIECYLPESVCKADVLDAANVTGTFACYSATNYNRWQMKPDMSLRAPDGYSSVEYVSPVLSGTNGIAEVTRVVNAIKDAGGIVNDKCGLHVHIGYESLLFPESEWLLTPFEKSKLINNMIDIFAEFDQSFMLMVDKNRWNKHYCGRYKDYCETDNSEFKSYARHKLTRSPHPVAFMGHYSAVNTEHFFNANEGKKTVEIRLLEGTLDAEKIEAWIWLCQRFVHRAFTSKIRATGRTRKFTDFLSFMKCDRADLKRGFDRNEQTKAYVDYLRKVAKRYNSSDTPYYTAHCNFKSYVRPKRIKAMKNLAVAA